MSQALDIAGFARKVGLSSPAIITTTFTSVSSLHPSIFFTFTFTIALWLLITFFIERANQH